MNIRWIVAPVVLAIAGCGTLPIGEGTPSAPMGFGQVVIEPVTNDFEQEAWLRVSPNGRYLIFNLVEDTGTDLTRMFDSFRRAEQQSGGKTAIAMIELGRAGKAIISQEGGREPSWFTDSRTIAFSMRQGRQTMLARSLIGEGVAAVRFVSPAPCVLHDEAPSISPDSKTIAFTSSGGKDGSNIALMDTRATTSKCNILFPGINPQWSPTARRFAFTRTVGGFDQVFVFDVEKNLLSQITFGNFKNYEATWSPDGKRVAFVSDRNGTPNIYIMNEDGTGLVQITKGPTRDRYPAWSSDGNIYFVSNAGNKTDIWRAKLVGR